MTTAEIIRAAIADTRMVQSGPKSYTVDTYDATRRAWIQGVQLDWRKARRALSECRVFMAARAMGRDAYDADSASDDYRKIGGDWRAYVRAMARQYR